MDEGRWKMKEGRGKREENRPTGEPVNCKNGQTSLEVTVALVIFAIFLVVAVRIFAWLNAGIVNRQISYDSTRVQAANDATADKQVAQSQLEPNPGTGLTPNDLIVQDTESGSEVGFDEPLNPDLNLSIKFCIKTN